MALLVSALVLTSLMACVAGQYVTVETNDGTLRGEATTTVNGSIYFRFSGVPFAAPPVGDLRFKEPQPHPGWEGVRDALEEGSGCLEVMMTVSGAEDCLYLNVYTPSLSVDAQLPVMLWMYGGAFITGDGSYRSYGPDFLVQEDVILVTFNYRLGLLGMLGLDDSLAPGNNVFKDQVAALRWVQANIAAFGGDPDKVTIFGQSAGGTSVELHMYSALSRGLFRAVISQSGSAIGGGQGLLTSNRDTAFCIGAALGLETDDEEELLAFLQSVDATSLYNTSCGSGALMTVEPEGEGAFLTTETHKLGAWAIAGNYTHVPLMSGVTSGEYNYMVGGDTLDDETVEELNSDFEGAIDSVLRLPDAESKQAAAEVIKPFYFGNVSTITADDAVAYAAMMTDLNNGEPADTTVHLVSTSNTYPVFYYQYDYAGASLDYGLPGAPHMADLVMLFRRTGPGPVQNLDPASDEQKVRNTMVKLWTNFAKYMNPTPDDDPVIEGGWPTFNMTTQYFLNIDVNSTVAQHRMGDRMDFLHSVIPPYY